MPSQGGKKMGLGGGGDLESPISKPPPHHHGLPSLPLLCLGCGQGVAGYPNIQNNPHDALLTLNIHKWGLKTFFKKFYCLRQCTSKRG